MTNKKLRIEILSGPRDGEIVTLETDAEWGREGTGTLSFPWDDELGAPQARVTMDERGWWLEPKKSPHGTYRVSKGERVEMKIQLGEDDALKAHHTWFLIRRVE
jgi:hypothetical protein